MMHDARPDPVLTEAWQSHRTMLHRFVLGRVRDRDAAEDIVHDVLLRAWKQRDRLRDRSKLVPWLHQMTRNAIVDHFRAYHPAEELPPDLPAPDHDRDAIAELAPCLTPFIEQLPDTYRDAIALSEVEGLTQQETAQRLGISLSGAKSRVQRGRARLQELLEACCRIERDHRGSVMDYEKKGQCGCS